MSRDRYINGLYFWSTFDEDNVINAMNYQPLDDDVIVVTYSKSGTTLMQNLVYLLKNKGEYADNFLLRDHFPFIEQQGTECLENLPRPRLVKTHLPYDKLVFSTEAKYIFVCRNPFDCCCSYYYHAKMLTRGYDFYGDFDEFFQRFMEEKVDFGDYFDHLNGWIKEKNRTNILSLTYEEIIKDLKSTVKNVGQFLGDQFLENANDIHILEKVVEKCSLSSMKAMDAAFHPVPMATGSNFIRKGVKGGYRTTMNKEQIEELHKKFIEKCSSTGATDLWKTETVLSGGIM